MSTVPAKSTPVETIPEKCQRLAAVWRCETVR
jgi:hypothetical protein